VTIETRRQQIEDAASALFRERGYPATSVRDIARALDMQGASLYAHVASKEDVLWSIVEAAADRFERAAGAAETATAGQDAATRLGAFVRAHVEVIADDVEHATAYVSEWRHLSEDRRNEVLARRDAYEARLRHVIREGQASGDFILNDATIAATFILTALNGIAAWYRPDGFLSPGQLGDLYADLAVRSLTEVHR
jgi:AcrR family transcriptional regulator